MAKRKKKKSISPAAGRGQRRDPDPGQSSRSGPADKERGGGKKTRSKAGKTKTTSRAEESGNPPEPGFPIVGIGASAGGIEAFGELLGNLPADTGMAFVFVQHLHPDHESALAEILSHQSAMPVKTAGDRMVVEPNHCYVMPAGSYLGIQGGKLQLLPRPASAERHLPIDQFFRYLADDQGTRAVGVILSGTASDGVLGLKAIKAAGGITFAQTEDTAKCNGMPHSAVASGAVDFVRSPEQIADELAHLARHPYMNHQPRDQGGERLPPGGDALDKVFMLMRRHRGHDFTYYKHTTIQRRVGRRMLLHKVDDLDTYVRYLQESPGELDELFRDMLINVTGFFRDPEVFDALAEQVFPSIIGDDAPDRPVRLWVPGCATGEEAYSMAIVMLEYFGERAASGPAQIFATDVDEAAIDRGRAGTYPESIAQDVGPERLRRFFTRVEGGYQVNEPLRNMCVFAVQNAVKDPPFSHLDLISCRNLLIYLGPVLQKRLMRTFHYALKPDGFMLLGTAESIGEFTDLFRAVDGKNKIYARKATVSPAHIDFGREAGDAVRQDAGSNKAADHSPSRTSQHEMQQEVDRLLMNRYVPAGVVINEDMEILLFRGRTGVYLEPAPGQANFNLLRMARDDLVVGLNNAVHKAMATGFGAGRDLRLKSSDGDCYIDIEVTPLTGFEGQGRHYLVVFKDIPGAAGRDRAAEEETPGTRKEGDGQVTRLEEELASTKEYLQSVIEEKETSNEELRSANEEIQSSNEELQSFNEELETAKEELQSTNEELTTVNDELESRNAELARVNDDLNNLVASVDLPMVIVSPDLRIRRFTSQARKLLNLIASDVGRPIGDLNPKVHVPDLSDTLRTVIDNIEPRRQEVSDTAGCWYSMRVRPYKTMDNRIDGAVVVFIEIDAMKRALDEARAARDYAEAVVSAVRHPMLVLDRNLRVVSSSAAYLSTFQVSDHETRDNLVYRLGNGQWAIPRLRKLLTDVVNEDSGFDNFEVRHDFEHIGTRVFRISGRQIPAGLPEGPMVVMQLEEAATGGEAGAAT